MLQFEWDPRRASPNHAKHGVSFREAVTVFGDPPSMTVPDPGAEGEPRYVILVMSSGGRLLVVVHADRGDKVRPISARRASAREVKGANAG